MTKLQRVQRWELFETQCRWGVAAHGMFCPLTLKPIMATAKDFHSDNFLCCFVAGFAHKTVSYSLSAGRLTYINGWLAGWFRLAVGLMYDMAWFHFGGLNRIKLMRLAH